MSRPAPDTVMLTPVGEADIFTAPSLRRALREAIDVGRPRLVVDLDRLTFLDASTLGALVAAQRRIATTGGTLHLRCNSQPGRRLLTITGLDGLLDPGA